MSKIGAAGQVANAAIQGAQSGGVWGAVIAAIMELFSMFEGFQEIDRHPQQLAGQPHRSAGDAFRTIVDAIKPLLGAVSFVINVVLQLLTPILEAVAGIFESITPLIWMIGMLLMGLQPVFDMLGKVIEGVIWVLDKIIWGTFQVPEVRRALHPRDRQGVWRCVERHRLGHPVGLQGDGQARHPGLEAAGVPGRLGRWA